MPLHWQSDQGLQMSVSLDLCFRNTSTTSRQSDPTTGTDSAISDINSIA